MQKMFIKKCKKGVPNFITCSLIFACPRVKITYNTIQQRQRIQHRETTHISNLLTEKNPFQLSFVRYTWFTEKVAESTYFTRALKN